jgi:hypothetical protein
MWNSQVGALDSSPAETTALSCLSVPPLEYGGVKEDQDRTYDIKVLAGDLVNKKKEDMVEENGEQRSKEEFIEYVEDPDSCTIHDILIPISGCKV